VCEYEENLSKKVKANIKVLCNDLDKTPSRVKNAKTAMYFDSNCNIIALNWWYELYNEATVAKVLNAFGLCHIYLYLSTYE